MMRISSLHANRDFNYRCELQSLALSVLELKLAPNKSSLYSSTSSTRANDARHAFSCPAATDSSPEPLCQLSNREQFINITERLLYVGGMGRKWSGKSTQWARKSFMIYSRKCRGLNLETSISSSACVDFAFLFNHKVWVRATRDYAKLNMNNHFPLRGENAQIFCLLLRRADNVEILIIKFSPCRGAEVNCLESNEQLKIQTKAKRLKEECRRAMKSYLRSFGFAKKSFFWLGPNWENVSDFDGGWSSTFDCLTRLNKRSHWRWGKCYKKNFVDGFFPVMSSR
jgi:hypothetical protein